MAAIRKIPVNVTEIIPYGDKVRLFRLKPKKAGIQFKAGQFLHLAVEPYDPSFNWPESRVFSIANSPDRSEFIDVLVSKIGKFTEEMFKKVKSGTELWIKLPYGVFNFDESIDHNTVLIAGGTGISPFMSFIQYAIDRKLNTAIQLYYGVKNKDLIIIDDLIQEALRSLTNFEYNLYIEEDLNPHSNLKFKYGILNVPEIVKNSLKMENPVFYLSGPPAMISAFELELNKHGVNQGQIKYDKWE